MRRIKVILMMMGMCEIGDSIEHRCIGMMMVDHRNRLSYSKGWKFVILWRRSIRHCWMLLLLLLL